MKHPYLVTIALLCMLCAISTPVAAMAPAYFLDVNVFVAWWTDDPMLVDYTRFPPVGERYIYVCFEVFGEDTKDAQKLNIEQNIDLFSLRGPEELVRYPLAWRAYNVMKVGEAFLPDETQRMFGFIYSIPRSLSADEVSMHVAGKWPGDETIVPLVDVIEMVYAKDMEYPESVTSALPVPIS